jgi:hypothetical protein
MSGRASAGQDLLATALGSASFVNDLIDMVNEWKRGGRPQLAFSPPIATDVIKVKNITGADQAAGKVLELGTLLYTPIDRRNLGFNADTVSHIVGRSYCVLPRPIPSGKIDDAHIAGVCVAKVNIQSTSDRYGFVESSSTVLKSGKTGQFKLLGPVTATGEQSVAVCFSDDGRPVRLCKPVSNIAKGASGTITLYDGETAGLTVTAKAIMGAVTGGGSPKWCTAFWDGAWFVLPGEC